MVWRSRPIQNKPQVLPDGTVLTLVQVDYGKTNVFYAGNWFQKTFRRWIPKDGIGIADFRLMPPNEIYRTESENDGLVFWAEGKASFASLHSDQGSWLTNSKAIIFNELGDEYPVVLGRPGAVYDRDFSWNWEITAFPRNGKTVGLRLLHNTETNGWQTLAEFITRNPTPGPHNNWTAESMPMVKTSGNLMFELKDLRVGKGLSGNPNEGDVMAARAIFNVTDNGKDSEAWAPGPVTMSEGNGNYYETRASQVEKTNSGTIWEFYNTLNPKEAWRLKIGFVRTRDFPFQELCEFKNLPIIPVAGTNTIRHKNVGQTTIDLQIAQSGSPWVNLNSPNIPKDRWIKLVKFVGDSGEVVEIDGVGSPNGLGSQIPTNQLKGSKTFNLTVAVTKPVYVEFTAKPTLTTNAPGR